MSLRKVYDPREHLDECDYGVPVCRRECGEFHAKIYCIIHLPCISQNAVRLDSLFEDIEGEIKTGAAYKGFLLLIFNLQPASSLADVGYFNVIVLHVLRVQEFCGYIQSESLGFPERSLVDILGIFEKNEWGGEKLHRDDRCLEPEGVITPQKADYAVILSLELHRFFVQVRKVGQQEEVFLPADHVDTDPLFELRQLQQQLQSGIE